MDSMKPLRTLTGLLLIMLAVFSARPGVAGAAEGAETAKARFPRLARGINVSWLGFYQGTGKFTFNRQNAQADLEAIKSTGCGHVRLVLNVDDLRGAGPRETPDPRNLPELDAAIKLVLDAGLAAIVDPFHYSKEGLIKFPGAQDPEAEVMVKFWSALAAHLAATDPGRVFLEVANEPGLDDPQDWYAVEMRIMKAIRAAAPRHTIIAGYNMKSGRNEWDSLKAMTMFPPVEDGNVIYNFHFYEPMEMTHQGASWAKQYTPLRGVPYPSTPEAIAPLLDKITEKNTRDGLARYGRDRWNKEKIAARIAIVAGWAQKRGVQVTCNEFGVYNRVAPVAARAAWTRDLREALERNGMGWTIWEEGFGFLKHQGGKVSLDEPIVTALGLKLPEGK